jgi:putative ABC transport system permease protein
VIRLDNIVKDYISGEQITHALKGVSLSFRQSEFVTVLGPSGCGKTTLLNIIGGLDRYTSGNLLINHRSTKAYRDNDWDAYRNHSIGFVFQSYNLINHISVLANVELALTLSGVSFKERKERAKKALIDVGLENEIHKLPNQLSNGQMQRVAIARALINNPQIVLADEPTGALDSETSLQVMALLKEIAQDRLVIMVTHNPELARTYATRIVYLNDGVLTDDSNPFIEEEKKSEKLIKDYPKKEKLKTSMSFLSALSLSLRNLATKKSRTILTAFAGSIGIIGIALILSISSGFSEYMHQLQLDTLSTYPLTIQKETTDYWHLVYHARHDSEGQEYPRDEEISSNLVTSNFIESVGESGHVNDLKSLRNHLESEEIKEKYQNDYSAIQYVYNTNYRIYSNTYDETTNTRLYPLNIPASFNASRYLGVAKIYEEMLDNKKLIESQYELLAGEYLDIDIEEDTNKVAIILDKYNRLPDYTIASLGLISIEDLMEGKDFKITFNDMLDVKLKLVPAATLYKKNNENKYEGITNNPLLVKDVLDDKDESIDVEVGAILRPRENITATSISGSIAYLSSLTKEIIKITNETDVVKDQLATPDIDVTTNAPFVAPTTLDNRISEFGICDLETPRTIHIYPTSFEGKDRLVEMIEDYNDEREINEQIMYTDYVDILMTSMTKMINAITAILIAFVSISLIVSSIMIGVITYISVLERTKEIGILRSIGARKYDISLVFNAETLLIGAFSGVLGVIIGIILNWPANIIIKKYFQVGVIAALPWYAIFALIGISTTLTLIAGLIPSRIAANKDPVVALRSDL